MFVYRTHSWPTVIARFCDLATALPAFAPLAAGVARIADSPFATDLHPVASMHTLLLYQHDRYQPEDPRLVLSQEGDELVLRYEDGRIPDRPAALPTAGAPVWTKRGSDGLALLERALHHLRWLVEYRAPAV